MERTIRPACLWTLALVCGLAHAASPIESDSPNVLAAATHASRIAAVESGLKPPVLVKGEPLPNWSLAERMAYYNVPGVRMTLTRTPMCLMSYLLRLEPIVGFCEDPMRSKSQSVLDAVLPMRLIERLEGSGVRGGRHSDGCAQAQRRRQAC